MAGAEKPSLPVAGRPMLHRVLAAVADASPRVVVGPAGLALPHGVLLTREHPPGGGPVAAAAAGLELVGEGTQIVALLAADLPLLTASAVAALRDALRERGVDGACYLDEGGRRQLLCGAWRLASLRAALHRLDGERLRASPADRDGLSSGRGEGLSGASMRTLLAGLTVVGVSWAQPGPPPWFDCDTDADLRRAEEWAR